MNLDFLAKRISFLLVKNSSISIFKFFCISLFSICLKNLPLIANITIIKKVAKQNKSNIDCNLVMVLRVVPKKNRTEKSETNNVITVL